MYTHIHRILCQWDYIILVQVFPLSSRVCQRELRNQMQSVRPEWRSYQPDFVLALEVGAPGSIMTLLWRAMGHPTHLWLVSLQPHSAALSFLSR